MLAATILLMLLQDECSEHWHAALVPLRCSLYFWQDHTSIPQISSSSFLHLVNWFSIPARQVLFESFEFKQMLKEKYAAGCSRFCIVQYAFDQGELQDRSRPLGRNGWQPWRQSQLSQQTSNRQANLRFLDLKQRDWPMLATLPSRFSPACPLRLLLEAWLMHHQEQWKKSLQSYDSSHHSPKKSICS